MWWMTQNVIHQKNLLRYGWPRLDILSSYGEKWWVTKTVTHHLEVVNGQIVHLLLSHNREGFVGGHFDHQPDICSTLLYKSGCYHFEKCHFTVTPNRSLPNPHSGNLGDYLKSSSTFRNLILAVTKPPELSFWKLRFFCNTSPPTP